MRERSRHTSMVSIGSELFSLRVIGCYPVTCANPQGAGIVSEDGLNLILWQTLRIVRIIPIFDESLSFTIETIHARIIRPDPQNSFAIEVHAAQEVPAQACLLLRVVFVVREAVG